jgi:hypothetical protein
MSDEVEKLRAALRPFAEVGKLIPTMSTMKDCGEDQRKAIFRQIGNAVAALTIRNFREAREALEGDG